LKNKNINNRRETKKEKKKEKIIVPEQMGCGPIYPT
jgi:hypothetical protein